MSFHVWMIGTPASFITLFAICVPRTPLLRHQANRHSSASIPLLCCEDMVGMLRRTLQRKPPFGGCAPKCSIARKTGELSALRFTNHNAEEATSKGFATKCNVERKTEEHLATSSVPFKAAAGGTLSSMTRESMTQWF